MSKLKELKNNLLKKFFKKKRKKTILDFILNINLFLLSAIFISSVSVGIKLSVIPLVSVMLFPFLTLMFTHKLINFFKLRNIKKSEDGFDNLLVFWGKDGSINRNENCPVELALSVKEDLSKSIETSADMKKIMSEIKKELSDEELSDLLANKYIMNEVDKNNGSLDNSLYLFKLLDLAIDKVGERQHFADIKNKDSYKIVKSVFDKIGVDKEVGTGIDNEIKDKVTSFKNKKEKITVD